MKETNKNATAVGTNDRSEKAISGNHSNNNPRFTSQQLLEAIKKLPKDWKLVAIGNNKAPLGKDWQIKPLHPEDFEKAIQTGIFESLLIEPKMGDPFHPPVSWWCAVGVLCGTPSGGLLFLDHDGSSCDPLIEELSGQSLAEALPKTIAVTSGREGRYQLIYKVSEEFWDAISTKQFPTGVKDADGKPEQLDLRWNGRQSVVVGEHPITGSYSWLPGQAPWECELAEAPKWMIESTQKRPLQQSTPTRSNHPTVISNQTEREWALSYLAVIPPTEDYDIWTQVGMALHSVNEDLLEDWDDWSRGGTNYELGACEKHWKSFKSNKGRGLGTLGHLAKQHGWQPPFKESKSERASLRMGGSSHNVQSLPVSWEEAAEDREELVQEVQSLLTLTEESAPIQNLLSPHLTMALKQRAQQFNVPLAAFVGLLLPVAASLLPIGTQVEISAASDHYASPLLWVGITGESGANKSPIFNTLLKPLEDLQAKADEIYQIELAQYETELENWQNCSKDNRGKKPTPPVPREYYLQDATLEAIAVCLSNQPGRGIVIPIDELAEFLNGFNKYCSGGKGNDRQKFLSVYNGRGFKVNRKAGPRISLSRTSISIVGTIQPCVLQQQMSDLERVDGFWPRFLWIPLPLTEMPPPGQGNSCDLSGLLKSLYERLESLAPQIYQLDQQGQQIWSAWHRSCEQHKVNEPNAALRAIYPKSKEMAARIALVVHCINAAIENRVPDKVIPSALLESAIAFMKWSIGQTRLIYADAGVVSHDETARIVRFVERFRGGGWIKAREVTHWWPVKPKLKAEAARVFMRRVVDLGYASDNGKTGRDYAIRISGHADNSSNNFPQPLQTLEFEPGNKSSKNLVTTHNTSDAMPAEQTVEIDNELSRSPKNSVVGVTTIDYSRNTSSSKGSSISSAASLPDVISTVISSESASGKALMENCYSVTGSKFQVGDLTVLNGKGANRPSAELSTFWTVEGIQNQRVLVRSEVGKRVFPVDWLDCHPPIQK